MSTAGGLKHVSTEPAPLANKRERSRRGASGRAAALRRAPSDSDCSGETASLSADSGERRPLPPKPGKTRSRRRGSEWEVLEGLKDGQRFDRRPEVFNGYLHKKRKWPLKGWHKRFFVVDGGILVYARSPTDVARGRLHGSVDVGLSVISAKARRRRIDIDADEFIYHLRAKTADVFRTWLNVLKVHRLYRQHLLTFGARESTPKAIEELPPPLTDTSSRTESAVTLTTTSDGDSSISRMHVKHNSMLPLSLSPMSLTDSRLVPNPNSPELADDWCKNSSFNSDLLPLKFDNFDCNSMLPLSLSPMSLTDSRPVPNADSDLADYWCKNSSFNSDLLPLKFDTFEDLNTINNHSNYSITYVTKKLHDQYRKVNNDVVNVNLQQSSDVKKGFNLNVKDFSDVKPDFPKKDVRNMFLGPTNKASSKSLRNTLLPTNTQVRDTDFYTSSFRSTKKYTDSKFLYQVSLNRSKTGISKVSKMMSYFKSNSKTCKKHLLSNSNSKRKLNDPTPICSLTESYKSSHDKQLRRSRKSTNLKRYKNLLSEPTLKNPLERSTILGEYQRKQNTFKSSISVNPVSIDTAGQLRRDIYNTTIQDSVSGSDNISANRRINILKNFKDIVPDMEDLKEYIRGIVNDICDGKNVEKDVIVPLFRSLFQYWLQNTSLQPLRDIIKTDKTTNKPSNNCLTEDKNLSGIFFSNICKETQHGICSNHLDEFRQILAKAAFLDQASREKTLSSSIDNERRIQELETLLKNTINMCEAVCSSQIKERDSEISKKIRYGLDTLDNSSSYLKYRNLSNSVSKSSMSAYVAKDFVDAYLHEDMGEENGTQLISKVSKAYIMGAESHQKTVSASKRTGDKYLTRETKPANKFKTLQNRCQTTESEDLYLNYLLNNIISNLKLSDKSDNIYRSKDKNNAVEPVVMRVCEINRNVLSKDRLVVATSTLLSDSECDLKRTSMLNNPDLHRGMSIIIDIEDNPNKCRSRFKSVCLDFSNVDRRYSTKNFLKFTQKTLDSRLVSTSDATSNELGNILRKIENSADFTINNNNYLCKWSKTSDGTSGLMFSSFHNSIVPNFQFENDRDEIVENDLIEQMSPPKMASVAKKVLSLTKKQDSCMINENFILLLLENIALLSKKVPIFHRDISALYFKLKQRYQNEMDYEFKPVFTTSSGIKNIFQTDPAYSRTKIQNCKLLKTKTYSNRNTAHIDITDSKEVHSFTASAIPSHLKLQSLSTSDNIVTVDKKMSLTLEKKSVDSSSIIDEETSLRPLYSSTIWRKTTIDKDIILFKNDVRFGPINYVYVDNKIQDQTDEIASSSSEYPNRHNTSEYFASKANTNTKDTIAKNEKVDINKNVSYVAPQTKKILKRLATGNDLFENQKQTTQQSSSHKVSLKVETETPRRNKGKTIFKKNKECKLLQLFFGKHCKKSTLNSSQSSSVLGFPGCASDLETIYRHSSNPSFVSDLISPHSPPIRGPQAGFVSGTPGGRLASWIVESGGPLETVSRELGQAQLSVQQLQRLLDSLELHQAHHDTDVSLEGASPNVKKDRRKFGLRKKKSSTKCSSIELGPTLHIDASSSHSTLSALTAPPSPGGGPSSMPTSASSLPMACGAARPQSLPAEALAPGPASISLTPDHLREDFTVLAKDLVHTLNGVVATLVCERGRLRAAMDAADGAAPPTAMVTALRTNLNTALQQNSELRSRLSRIHDASDIADVTAVHHDVSASRPFHQSLSFSSSCVSASEFFDAEEHEDEMKTAELLPGDEAGVIELDGDSSSEAGSLTSHGSEASASSENSDPAMLSAEPRTAQNGNGALTWSRRTTLPSPRPTPGGPSLWNLLYKNIGKDLSQISMPVTINEPLNMLQRLCEELEYSELLESAAHCSSGVERMALVAAFAVSAYAAAAHRAASKPFNPLLAETYECVRDDRSFRFIAEQVSHHPPVSACHADSPAWSFWQEARIKTKFWGKSMEFQPAGRVHVRLNTTGDHYSWNKVTTCVHNLFGGQRWVDQYGEMTIVCHGTQITCKLNFVKASSWSSSRHEVRGAVTDGSTGARLRLQGRWSEALYAGEPPAARCLWRPGAMPPEHEQYYGFTRFAMELNELEPGLRRLLPPTDTRLRPDQRALEEGDVEAAEQYKLQLEQTQRERRRDGTEHAPQWFRKTVYDGEEMWVFGGEYWKAREAGYAGHTLPSIW